jgi:hypothetical protein
MTMLWRSHTIKVTVMSGYSPCSMHALTSHSPKTNYPTAEDAFCLTPNVTRAKSEGMVRLRSDDPSHPLSISGTSPTRKAMMSASY